MTVKQETYRDSTDYQTRLSKLSDLEEQGVDPYPHVFEEMEGIGAIGQRFTDLKDADYAGAMEGTTPRVRTAGRVILFRAMGKNCFATIQHHGKSLQILCNRDTSAIVRSGDTTASESLTDFKCIEKKLDLGDYIGVEGNLFFTQKGELTLFVKELTLLSKALLPLPDKHNKLSDKEARYRKRHLDLISNHEVFDTFLLRSRVLREVRNYFEDHQFVEVETPVLQQNYGGANARPFTTHLNALNQDMFLRISLELPLKKLLVGGFDRIFEIGKVFRNEGIDKTHNPEFTMLESYAAFWDYHQLMEFTENLIATVAQNVLGTTVIGQMTNPDGVEVTVDLKAPWKRISMKDSIREYAKLDVDGMSDEQMAHYLIEQTEINPNKTKGAPRGMLISYLFEELVEPYLLEPHHITDHPLETTPLCKLHRDKELRAEKIIERFETFVCGNELINAYSELNDSVQQYELLASQERLKQGGDDEACPMDEEFVEAMAHGMPPAGGVGIGIDRLIMLLSHSPTIREVIFFPLMKREDQ
ncbi:MAG: Lysine--tRNA ligase [Chlamydiia bacterium]|nr:Lysine--tRNA ligase [Chlamydiia bacterium]